MWAISSKGRVQVLNVEGRRQVPEPSSALGLALLGLGAATVTLRKRGQQKPVFSLEKTLQKQC
ncbi:PEP-CTERM sorting domain-containing protein [Nostoc sp. DSM 114160]